MSNEPLIVTKRDDGVAIISINDDPLNRMSVAFIDLLEEVIEDIDTDDSVRAFVLTACSATASAAGSNSRSAARSASPRPKAPRSDCPRWTSAPRPPGVGRPASRSASAAPTRST